jgi:hypothetical protein
MKEAAMQLFLCEDDFHHTFLVYYKDDVDEKPINKVNLIHRASTYHKYYINNTAMEWC